MLNTLLTIEVALFGVSATAIVVFIQLAYSHLTSRQVSAVFNQISLRVYLIFYGVFSLTALGITAIGCIRTAFAGRDLLPSIDMKSSIFVSFTAVILSFFIILLSMLFFLLLVRVSVGFLQPSSFLSLFIRKADYKAVRLFLIKRFGIQAPDEQLYHKRVLDILPEERLNQLVKGYRGNGNLELSESETKMLNQQQEKEAEILRADLKTYNQLMGSAAKAVNPLEPIFEAALQALYKGDLLTFRDIQGALCNLSRELIESAQTEHSGWNPDSQLVQNYADLVVEQLQAQAEISRQHEFGSALMVSLDTSVCIAKSCLSSRDPAAAYAPMSFWKNEANRSIGATNDIFKKVIDIYKEISIYILNQLRDSGKESLRHVLDEALRNVGWLGEKLFAGEQLEQEPAMYDSEYYTDYDSLLNCLYELGREYVYRHPETYPLILFDAIGVVNKSATKAFITNRDNDKLKHMLYQLPHMYQEFAEAAINSGNGDGAMLAVIRLTQAYRETVDKKLEKQASDLADMLLRLATSSVVKKSDFDLKNRWNTDIDVWIIKELEAESFAYIRPQDVFEVFIHSVGTGKHDVKWQFIKQLGVKMGTNFGLMFDAETGEDYSKDDPRRR